MKKFISIFPLVLTMALSVGSRAQDAVGPFISTVGTTAREAGNNRDWAYLLWTANEAALLNGRAHAIYAKPGDANAAAAFGRVAVVSLQSEAITLAPLLKRAALIGDDTNALHMDINALFGKFMPANLTLSEKMSAVVRGAVQDPKHFGRLILLSRTHPSVAMAAGFGHRYRTSASQDWTTYTEPFVLISDAVVEYHGRRLADGVLTPTSRAAYTFSEPLDTLDSDHDGVPDFVEQTRGLDPLGGADSDHDGFTDLEEMASGTNPRSALNKPASNASLRNAFNRLVSPRPPHPSTSGATAPLNNVAMNAYALGGAFLGYAATSSTNSAGATNPAALFLNLRPEAGSHFIVESTSAHFNINAIPDRRVGRELIGLIAIPPTNHFQAVFRWATARSPPKRTAGSPRRAMLWRPRRIRR